MDINKPKYNIHVFGDSHARLYGSKNMTDYIFNVYYVGAITMFRIGRDVVLIDELKHISKKWYQEYSKSAKPVYKHLKYPINDEINNGDVVIFVFGEIDVRNHILKQSDKQKRPVEDIVRELVEKYVQVISMNKLKYPNITYIIQSIIPPTSEENIGDMNTADYPNYGTTEERIVLNYIINKELEKQCHIHNILFMDVTTYYENDRTDYPLSGLADRCLIGELDKRVKDANVHVNMSYPEGYVLALKHLDIPPNINTTPYNKVCKYPSALNAYQRELYYKLRITHYVWIMVMLMSLLVPYDFLLIPTTIWIITILLNLLFSEGNCIWNYLEFRVGNCNNKSLTDELGIPKKYSKVIVATIYMLGILILITRWYFKV